MENITNVGNIIFSPIILRTEVNRVFVIGYNYNYSLVEKTIFNTCDAPYSMEVTG